MPIDGVYDYNYSAEQIQRQRRRLARQKARKAAKWQKIKADFAKRRSPDTPPAT